MRLPELKHLTESEYLELEKKASIKHEYFNGEIFAMSGASIAHNIISNELFFIIDGKTKRQKMPPFRE